MVFRWDVGSAMQGAVSLFALAIWICSVQLLVLLVSERSAVFRRGQAVLGCGWLHHEQGGMGFVYVFCKWHCAFAVVSGLYADFSMQLSASSGVVPVGVVRLGRCRLTILSGVPGL